MSVRAAPPIVDAYKIQTPSGSPPPYAASLTGPLDPKRLRGYRVLVFVAMGQSNAANMSVGYTYTSNRPGRVLQLDPENGALYPYLADPLIGATGNGGHWVLDMADRLINADQYDYVVVVGIIAVGGASIEYFAPGSLSTLKHRFLVAGERLRDAGLRPSCWNFALGESAILYPEAAFRAPLDAMIAWVRAQGYVEPWILDITTRNTVTTDPSGTNVGARLALQHAPNGVDILAGVDTDDLTYPTYRLDESGARVHLNAAGCQMKAQRKAANIIALKPLLANPFL